MATVIEWIKNMDTSKVILVCGAVMVFAMLLYPPFTGHTTKTTYNAGYAFLFSPPPFQASVNIGMLLTQWVGVVTVTFILYFITKKN
jgi:Trk-type K+ transport system membrane component